MSDGQTSSIAKADESESSSVKEQDDTVLPFQTDLAGAMGRIVRLGPSIDKILTAHNYPDPVAHALGEALTLTAMLGTTLKMQGRLILQTTTDGPLRMLVVNFDAPGNLRGYASFDDSLKNTSAKDIDQKTLLGTGHMALTVDPGGKLDRYQGIVALNQESLSSAALTYFHQSEQLPTYLRLAVAREFTPKDKTNEPTILHQEQNQAGHWRWRAGGLLIQHVATTGGKHGSSEKSEDNITWTDDGDNDPIENWNRTRILAASVEDHELIDPTLSSQRLLYRLFHEEGVRVNEPYPLKAACRCSRERVEAFVQNFKAEELAGLREKDGGVTVTCEFCNSAYHFEPNEV